MGLPVRSVMVLEQKAPDVLLHCILEKWRALIGVIQAAFEREFRVILLMPIKKKNSSSISITVKVGIKVVA